MSPAVTSVGLLPSFPLLAAAPDTDGRVPGGLWWLAAGVAAGVVSASVAVLSRRRARFDETAIVGALSGILTALVVCAVAWLAGGSLGTARLAEVGPRMPALLIMSTSTLGLSGLVTGLVVGVLRGGTA